MISLGGHYSIQYGGERQRQASWRKQYLNGDIKAISMFFKRRDCKRGPKSSNKRKQCVAEAESQREQWIWESDWSVVMTEAHSRCVVCAYIGGRAGERRGKRWVYRGKNIGYIVSELGRIVQVFGYYRKWMNVLEVFFRRHLTWSDSFQPLEKRGGGLPESSWSFWLLLQIHYYSCYWTHISLTTAMVVPTHPWKR